MYRKQLCVAALCLTLGFAACASAQIVSGKALVEYWFGNGIDANLDNLKADPDFPNNPADAALLDAFEQPDVAAWDYWGGRLRAWLTPPETGDYTFWTASDDDSEVWLSTDDTADNARLICSVEGWTGWRNYAGTEGSPGPNQKSAPIALEAGKKYYIEGLFSDGTGGGHMSVGWAGPGIGDTAVPISGAYLEADSAPLYIAKTPDPASGAVDWESPLLKWTPGTGATLQKVYFGTTPELTEADLKMTWPGTVALLPVTEPLTPGATYYWRVDSVAAGGVYTGPVWNFTVTPLTAHFPSPPDGALYRPTNLTVSWTPGQNASSFKVYGSEIKEAVETANPAALLIEQEETSVDASALLEPGKTYYWRVDTIDLNGDLQAGPVWMFTTYDPAGGAVAEYWDNRFLSGAPKVVKKVGTINFDWGDGPTQGVNSPDENIPTDNFSCRWWAELQVPVTGTYKLYEASDDGARLFLNGEQVANGWWDRGTTEDATGNLELVAGERYLVLMEMYENGGGATAFLRWSGPGIAKEIIPQGILQIPEMAVGQMPANGATGVADVPELSWIAGKTAVEHDVFLGTDPNLVAAGDASTLQGRVAEASFTVAAPLVWNTTYYWRVDEVRADGTVVPGLVTSFTVMDHLVLDDFESYDAVPVPPASAPIGWWKLDGNFADSSGYGHDGTPIGDGITFVDDPVRGVVLSLPGTDNSTPSIYVDIGAVGLSGNMPTTIACWAKADSTNIPDWTLIFGFTGTVDGQGGNGSHFNIGSLGGPGGVGAHCWGWEETIFTDQQALEWHHYAMTYDGTTIRYYGDGKAMDTDPGKSNVQDLSIRGDRVFIGSRVTQNSSFPGEVSDARIYNYALSPGEVADVADAVPVKALGDVWTTSGAGVSTLDVDYVHGGLKALTLTYDGPAEVSCAPALVAAQGSIGALSLWFYGDRNSTADQVYVKVNDTQLPLRVDPKDGSWQQAVVDLTSLDLQEVASLAIGVAGGAGILTVDDITLYCAETAPVIKPVVVWVSFHGADDTPSSAAAGVGFTEAVDRGYTDLLEGAGYEVVRLLQTGSPDLAVVNGADLVIISRSVASGSFQNANADTWNGVTAPMIILNGYTARKSRMGYYTGSNIPDITGDIMLAVADPSHPIFAGIALTDGVMDNPFAGLAVYPTDGTTASGISVVTDPINAEGTVLATLSAASGTVTAGSVMIAEWPAGATLTHDGGAGTNVLAGHRLLFLSGSRENGGKSSETAGMFDLAPDGAQMFLNAVAYMIE
jgi:hypothetical protein